MRFSECGKYLSFAQDQAIAAHASGNNAKVIIAPQPTTYRWTSYETKATW